MQEFNLNFFKHTPRLKGRSLILNPKERILLSITSIVEDIKEVAAFGLLGLFIFILIYELLEFIQNLDLGPIILIIIMGFAFIGFYFCFKLMNEENAFIITDKKIYVYSKLGGHEFFYSIELGWIYLVTYTKRKFFDKNGDSGTINIIYKDPEKFKICESSLKNVKNVSQYQKMIDSIIYEYGTIKDALKKFEKQPKFNFPRTLKIADEKMKRKHDKIKRYNIYIMITLIISIIIDVIIIIMFNKLLFINFDGFYVTIFVIFFVILIELLFIIWNLSEKYILIKKSQFETTSLTMNLNEIVAFNETAKTWFPFQEETILSHFRIELFVNTGEYDKFLFGFELKNGINDEKSIKFGLFDNFLDELQFLYAYLISWKSKQGFLLSKDQVLQSEETNINQITPINEVKLEKLDLNEEIFTKDFLKQVKSDLNEEENIYFQLCIKNRYTILTNQRVIGKHGWITFQFTYSEISSIRKIIKNETYQLIFNFDKPLKNSPNLNPYLLGT